MRRVANKWLKFVVLQCDSSVAQHIPAMQRYSRSNLRRMLNRYRFVVAKPLVGTGGRGVVKIEKLGSCRYRYQHASRIRTVTSLRALTRGVNRIRRRRRYMVQQGIRLAKIKGRPVDYRVKMVKSDSRWRITAVVGRVARQGQFVTNICRGGDLLSGYAALRRSFSAKAARQKKATMRGVARTCTGILEQQFPGIGSLGYDFGVDRKGRIWMFEVNTKPH